MGWEGRTQSKVDCAIERIKKFPKYSLGYFLAQRDLEKVIYEFTGDPGYELKDFGITPEMAEELCITTDGDICDGIEYDFNQILKYTTVPITDVT